MTQGYRAAYKNNQYAGMAPERIVLALYDGALSAMTRASEAFTEQKVADRGQAISKAIAIVGELKACLRPEAGGEVAANLGGLYDYIGSELITANLKQDASHLDRSSALLQEIRDGWAEMVQQQAAIPVPAAASTSASYV